jgi:hypothetical protein
MYVRHLPNLTLPEKASSKTPVLNKPNTGNPMYRNPRTPLYGAQQ